MSNKVSNRVADAWSNRIKQREKRTISADIGLFVFSILALNPITQVLVHQLSLDASLRAVSGGALLLIMALSVLVTLFSLILTVVVAGFFLNADIVNDGDGYIRKTELKYEFISAKNLLSLESTAIQKNLFNDKTIYEVAENKEYFIGDFVFGTNSRFRIAVFFIGLMLNNALLGWILNNYSFSLILIHAIATAGIMIVTEILFAFFYKFKNKKGLLELVNETGDSRIWCEYKVDIKSFNLSYRKLSWLSKDDLLLRGLIQQAQNADTQIKKTLLALQLLSDNAYAAINTMNSDSIKLANRNDEEKYTSDSRKLKTVINGYAPACIKKVEDNFNDVDDIGFFNIKNSDDQNPASKLDSRISVAYKELYDDIVAQDEVVKSIHSYYLDCIENSVLVSFRDVIDRRAGGWIDAEEDVYSLKTSVINESINKRVIPKLESLLVNASKEDALKLQSKIAEFREFFRKQVEIDEKENSVKRITQERDVSIDIGDGKVPKRSPIEQEIMDADFYLQQLKKEW